MKELSGNLSEEPETLRDAFSKNALECVDLYRSENASAKYLYINVTGVKPTKVPLAQLFA